MPRGCKLVVPNVSIGPEEWLPTVAALLEEALKRCYTGDELEKERDNDNEVFESITCWCEANEEEKTKSIEDMLRSDTISSDLIRSLPISSDVIRSGPARFAHTPRPRDGCSCCTF